MRHKSLLLLACMGWLLPTIRPAVDPGSATQGYTIQTIAGTNDSGDGGLAAAAVLGQADGIAVDSHGVLYIADAMDNRIRKVSGGLITTIAGTGVAGFSGDGGPATAAQVSSPYGIAVAADGTLYFADLGNARIRRIDTNGRIDTVAGGGSTPAAQAEGAAATGVRLAAPRNVALDGTGALLFSDFGGHSVYRVERGLLRTVAGNGTAGYSGDGAPATVAQLSYPAGIAVSAAGAVYVADSGNRRVRRVESGVINTVTAVQTSGTATPLPLVGPTGVSLGADGSLYVADKFSGYTFRVAGMTLSTLSAAGRDVAVDAAGAVFVADGHAVSKVVKGSAAVVAGTGYYGYSGDNGPAASARVNQPAGAVLDVFGNLFVADTGNHRIRKITPAGVITTVAGTGERGFGGDRGQATAAQLDSPAAVAIDPSGNLYIADAGNHRIRRVTIDGLIATIAGAGTQGWGGDGGPALQASLDTPSALALDRDQNLYIADSGNQRVRKLSPAGVMWSFAGSGVKGHFGDGGLALVAQLDSPGALAFDAAGTLYIADTGNNAIRKVTADGVIREVAGADVCTAPAGIAAGADGTLFIADTGGNRVRRLQGSTATTIAGTGAAGPVQDGVAADTAALNAPMGLVFTGSGAIYVADSGNNRIRKLTPGAPVQVVVDPPPPPPPPPVVVTETVPGVRVVSGGSFAEGPVAPGEIVSLFGSGLGPATGVTASPTALTLGGVQVLIGGVPAPLFWAQDGQVNAQAPYDLAGKQTADVQVIYLGVLKAKATVTVVESNPALITAQRGSGQALAANPDGTLNSVANPAARGSVMTFYATGEGQRTPAGQNGVPAGAPLGQPLLPVRLLVGSEQADVLYAGAAPGFVGLMQINARIPPGNPGAATVPVRVLVGNTASPAGVTIAVK